MRNEILINKIGLDGSSVYVSYDELIKSCDYMEFEQFVLKDDMMFLDIVGVRDMEKTAYRIENLDKANMSSCICSDEDNKIIEMIKNQDKTVTAIRNFLVSKINHLDMIKRFYNFENKTYDANSLPDYKEDFVYVCRKKDRRHLSSFDKVKFLNSKFKNYNMTVKSEDCYIFEVLLDRINEPFIVTIDSDFVIDEVSNLGKRYLKKFDLY